MAFNGTEGGSITEQKAIQLVTAFRQNNPNQIKGIYFDKTIFQQLLAQTGATGIRIYFGEENNTFKLVLVGAKQDGNDITDLIMDMGVACPTNCSQSGPLK